MVDAVVGRIENELESIPDDGTTTSVRDYKDSIARDLSGALCLTLVNTATCSDETHLCFFLCRYFSEMKRVREDTR